MDKGFLEPVRWQAVSVRSWFSSRCRSGRFDARVASRFCEIVRSWVTSTSSMALRSSPSNNQVHPLTESHPGARRYRSSESWMRIIDPILSNVRSCWHYPDGAQHEALCEPLYRAAGAQFRPPRLVSSTAVKVAPRVVTCSAGNP